MLRFFERNIGAKYLDCVQKMGNGGRGGPVLGFCTRFSRNLSVKDENKEGVTSRLSYI